jgi:alkylhydroperoxidase family enzyme
MKSHAAVAAELLGDEALVAAVVRDPEASPLDARHKALFRYLDRVNHESPRLTAADAEEARAHGWTDEALWFGITVVALFNFYNRWIDATGVHALSDEAHRAGGRRSARTGYVR